MRRRSEGIRSRSHLLVFVVDKLPSLRGFLDRRCVAFLSFAEDRTQR